VERAFGVWKRRFEIIHRPREYALWVQRDLVYATMAIHNYISIRGGIRDLHRGIGRPLPTEDSDYDVSEPLYTAPNRRSQGAAMERLRDAMATNMWQDYSQYIRDTRV
jgi:hypothetical protein